MKKHLLAVLAVMALSLPAAAADRRQALETIRPLLDTAAFSGADLSAQDQLVLKAADKYSSMPASARAARTSGALLEWKNALGSDAPAALMLSVRFNGGGELWLLKPSGPAKIDEWSDTRLPFTPEQPNTDRFFGYIGGQYMRGGGSAGNTTGFNGRLGKTFMNGRYDAALLYGYLKLGSDYSSSSYGLTGRALFPWTDHVGWNVGGSLTRSAPSPGDAVTSLGVLGGINFFLPGGSFDVTALIGNHSTYSLLIGYTLYLTRK